MSPRKWVRPGRSFSDLLWRHECVGYLFLAILVSAVMPWPCLGQIRSFDGVGNNIVNPGWGSAGANFVRLDSMPNYGDGMASPGGATAPNPREISHTLGMQANPMRDAANRSDYVWQWGQFLDHDITLTPGGTEFFPVMIGDTNDPLWPMVPMMRSAFDPTTGTSIDNPRQQLNLNTSFIDASMVYGSSQARADALRSFSGGLLNTSPGDLLPRNIGLLENANEGPEPDQDLFLAGDIRANEQLGLTAMHTLFVREHNRVAGEIAGANPNLSDESIFQRARKIVGGIVQNITYSEYLPALLGTSSMLPGGTIQSRDQSDALQRIRRQCVSFGTYAGITSAAASRQQRKSGPRWSR